MEVGMLHKSLVALIALLLPLAGVAQPRGGMPGDEPGEQRTPFFFFELVNLVGDDSSLARLDIPYRIDQSFFIAVVDPHSRAGFVSRGDLLIELVDSLGVSVSRHMESIEIETDKAEGEIPGQKWHRGIASFQVPPGPYKIILEIDDRESERRHIDNNARIRLRRLTGDQHETSTPLFILRPRENAHISQVTPVGFGPHLRYGENASLFLELPSAALPNKSTWVDYKISIQSGPDKNEATVLTDTVRSPLILRGIRLQHSRGDSVGGYTVATTESSRTSAVIIPLASEKLPLRSFELSVALHSDTIAYTATKRFMMVWPDMPRSLRDIDYAILALKYITTEDKRDSLRRGSFEERRDKLEAYWKGKDNTPGTEYNEVMVEYYRRVDFASRNFGTLREPDGFKSDRGRIYILYGPPTLTDRVLDPANGYQEVWVYEKTGKKFIFADQTKSGNYVLISTQTQ